jgi:hypothetical protein
MFEKVITTIFTMPLSFAYGTMKEIHANLELAGPAMVLVTAGAAVYFAFTYSWVPMAVGAAVTALIWIFDNMLVAEIRVLENMPIRPESEWQNN